VDESTEKQKNTVTPTRKNIKNGGGKLKNGERQKGAKNKTR
jgi:hypothetical protein